MRVTSQNVQHLPVMRRRKVRHDVATTMDQSDIVGWQEMQNNHGYWSVLREMENVGWETYSGAGRAIPGQAETTDNPHFDVYYSTPISWRTGMFEFVKGGRFVLTPGSEGISGNRFLTWVKLRDRETGGTFTVVNVHMIVGAHSYKYFNHRERRRIWDRSFAKLIGFVRDVTGPVVVTGDFNGVNSVMRPRPDTWRVMFGNRVDHVVLVGRWRLRRVQTLLGRFSDHPGARVVIDLRVRLSK